MILKKRKTMITNNIKALAVHLLTASGAVFAMLAILAAAQAEWSMVCFWIVIAFVVDGIDGPLARHVDVETHCPRFNGVILDMIVDYLTYVFIPAFALFESGLLPGWTGWFAIIIITFTSALYFADTNMKSKDNSFCGYPGVWNLPMIVLFAMQPNSWITLAIIVTLAIAMFLPIKFVHPFRTVRWRKITLPIAIIWTACAGWAAWIDFAAGSPVYLPLVVASIYLLVAGAVQQFFPLKAVRA
jgi:phosphatidylcholine synthase